MGEGVGGGVEVQKKKSRKGKLSEKGSPEKKFLHAEKIFLQGKC